MRNLSTITAKCGCGKIFPLTIHNRKYCDECKRIYDQYHSGGLYKKDRQKQTFEEYRIRIIEYRKNKLKKREKEVAVKVAPKHVYFR